MPVSVSLHSSRCKAVFYCADKCSLADREHERWCAKMATYMDHQGQLADLSFSYAAGRCTEEDYCASLLFIICLCQNHRKSICPHLSFSFYPTPLFVEVTSEDFSLEDFLCKNKLVSRYWMHWSLLVHSPQPQIIPIDAYCIWLAGYYS